MVKIRWTREAAAALEGIHDYIAKDSEQYARLQVETLLESLENLKTHPRLGRHLPEFPHLSHREIIVDNYRVIYHHDPGHDTIQILTIAHGRQRIKPLRHQPQGRCVLRGAPGHGY